MLVTQDSRGLLAKIGSAHIFTWYYGNEIDLHNLRPTKERAYAVYDWQGLTGDLELVLKNHLDLKNRLGKKISPIWCASRQKVVHSTPRIVIDNHLLERFTIIEVFANVRPGLLNDITRTLTDFELNIHRAKISAGADRAFDVFYTQDASATKISKPLLFQKEVALAHIARNDRKKVNVN